MQDEGISPLWNTSVSTKHIDRIVLRFADEAFGWCTRLTVNPFRGRVSDNLNIIFNCNPLSDQFIFRFWASVPKSRKEANEAFVRRFSSVRGLFTMMFWSARLPLTPLIGSVSDQYHYKGTGGLCCQLWYGTRTMCEAIGWDMLYLSHVRGWFRGPNPNIYSTSSRYRLNRQLYTNYTRKCVSKYGEGQ